MPSLFTHLLIAEKARRQMAAAPLRQLIDAHENAYFLGALAPDLAYFDIFHSYRGLPLGTFLSPLSHTTEERVRAWMGWSLPSKSGWAQRLHNVNTYKLLKTWALHAHRRHPAFMALVAG